MFPSCLQLGVDVNGQHSVVLGAANVDGSPSVGSDGDGLARAGGTALGAGDDVAVGAGGQARLQGAVQVVVVVVEGHEAAAASAEGDLVAAVVPPVLDLVRAHGVSEGHHVVDLAPAVLTHPAAAAGVVAIEDGRGDVVAVGGGRALIGVREGEGGHHAGSAEWVRQHEGGGHLVLLGHLVGQHVGASCSMSALVVVVVDEYQGAVGGSEAPGGAPVGQVLQLVLAAEDLADGVGVAELGDGAQSGVLGLADGLAAHVDDLLDDVRLGSRGEAVVGVQVLEAAIDDGQVGGPHVLGGVHAESGHAEINQMVQELDHLVLHVGVALVEVAQTDQLAVAHLVGVVVVADGAGRVEVQRGVGHSGIALAAGAGGAAASAVGASVGGHVVEDHVHVGAHSDGVAALDHAGELLFVSGAGLQLVGDGLVTFPPGAAVLDGVLVHRGDLNTGVAIGSQEVLALGSDVVPLPLEEVDHSTTTGCVVGVELGVGHRQEGEAHYALGQKHDDSRWKFSFTLVGTTQSRSLYSGPHCYFI